MVGSHLWPVGPWLQRELVLSEQSALVKSRRGVASGAASHRIVWALLVGGGVERGVIARGSVGGRVRVLCRGRPVLVLWVQVVVVALALTRSSWLRVHLQGGREGARLQRSRWKGK